MVCPDKKKIYLDKPINRPNKPPIKYFLTGCGKCSYCKSSIKRDLVFRMEQEAEDHDPSTHHFSTLTYNEPNLPADKGLHYEHVRLYLDRLRKAWGKISWFLVGEYGEETHRPHWHIMSWGIPQQLIQEKWPYGYVHPGTGSLYSAMYCVNYLDKSMYEELKKDPQWLGNQEIRKWSYGLGKSYYDKIQWGDLRSYLINGNLTVQISNGTSLQLPRYYRKIIQREQALEPEHIEYLKERRIISMMDNYEKKVRLLESNGISLYSYDLMLKENERIKLSRRKPRVLNPNVHEQT